MKFQLHLPVLIYTCCTKCILDSDTEFSLGALRKCFACIQDGFWTHSLWNDFFVFQRMQLSTLHEVHFVILNFENERTLPGLVLLVAARSTTEVPTE